MKTHLTCDACERELCAYLDGALHPAVARAIGSHLDSCARCSSRLAAYRVISAGLAGLPELAAPSWLERRVLIAVGAGARLRRLWTRGLAAAAALAFALTVGLIAHLPQIARQWGLPDPTWWPVIALRALIDGIVALAKRLAVDATFYEPIARQLWAAVQALEAIPRVMVLTLRTPEAQAAAAVLVTLMVALYFALRPSRSREGGIGHACLCL